MPTGSRLRETVVSWETSVGRGPCVYQRRSFQGRRGFCWWRMVNRFIGVCYGFERMLRRATQSLDVGVDGRLAMQFSPPNISFARDIRLSFSTRRN